MLCSGTQATQQSWSSWGVCPIHLTINASNECETNVTTICNLQIVTICNVAYLAHKLTFMNSTKTKVV